MDASLTSRSEELARQIAQQANGLDDLNGLFRSMMASALQCMPGAEMDHHLGRVAPGGSFTSTASSSTCGVMTTTWPRA